MKTLALLLGLDVVLAILVTPAGGMDPRPPAGASTLGWICVGLFMVGLVVNTTAIVQLFRGKTSGARLATFGPLLHYPVIATDRLGIFHAMTAPDAIRNLEWTVAVVSAAVIALAISIARGSRPARSPRSSSPAEST